MTHDDELRLHAYLDGELGATESLEMERRLNTDAELRGQLADLRAIGARIRAQAHYHDAPPQVAASVMARVRQQAPRARTRIAARWSAFAAAGAVAFAAAWLAVPALRLQVMGADGAPIAQVLDDHLRANFSGRWVDVGSSDRHTVKPWLSSQLGFSPAVPDLADQGFELVGGRVDVVEARPVATLVYRRRQHMISVFVWPMQDPLAAAAVRASERRGYQILRWSASGFVYWAVSDLNQNELREFARLLSSSQ